MCAVAVVPVHPRGRGEHSIVPVLTSRECRFIPAGAGNTRQRPGRRRVDGGSSPRARGTPVGVERRMPPASVHPRGRGEHMPMSHSSWQLSGSSPRARGTRSSQPTAARESGSSPRARGTLTDRRLAAASGAVHPRGRGEHVIVAVDLLTIAGSSPRARGTRRTGATWVALGRFIPAGAGNTDQTA